MQSDVRSYCSSCCATSTIHAAVTCLCLAHSHTRTLTHSAHAQESLDARIIQYHESGYIEELKDRYFRHSHCKSRIKDELQGEAERMTLDQQGGQYVLLIVGIVVCIGLVFLEHATFKWLVPYWRKKPDSSFWKSTSMMFWSQVRNCTQSCMWCNLF